MQQEKNIDDIFKQKAQNFGVKVPAEMFDKITGDLKKRKKRRKLAFIIFFVSLISIGIAGLLLVFSGNKSTENLIIHSKSNVESSAQSQTVSKNKTLEKSVINHPDDSATNSVSSKNIQNQPVALTDKNKPQEPVKHVKTSETLPKSAKTISIEHEIAITEKSVEENNDALKIPIIIEQKISVNSSDSLFATTEHKQENSITNPGNEKIINQLKSDSINQIPKDTVKKNEQKPALQKSEPKNPEPVNQNLYPIPDLPVDNHKFSIGMTFGKGKTFKTGQTNSISRDFIAESSNDKMISSFNTTIYLRYSLTKRFSLSTGISFFKFGNTAKFAVQQNYLRYIYSNDFGYASAGFYDINLPNLETALNSNGFYTVDCIRKFETIRLTIPVTDIPVTVDFNLFEYKRIKLELMAGLNVAFLQKSTVEIGINNNYYSVGSLNNLRKSIPGYSAGLAIGYAISDGLEFRLEPIYRRYYKSVSTSGTFDYFPYIYSVNAGLFWKF